MTDKIYSHFEEGAEDLPLTPAEIEVRLAIADFVIQQVNATAAGEVIFESLVKCFENRYPHHKLLTNYLLSPGHLVPDPDDDEADIPLNQLDAKLMDMLRYPEKSLEPAGPLAGRARPNGRLLEDDE